MADEGFLRRWSRLKSESPRAPAVAKSAPAVPRSTPPRTGVTQSAPAAPHSALESTPPTPGLTLDDVAALNADSDFAPFVTREVDADVRRSALRKLFTDPHFNRMDGLDVYIGDYTQASPMPAAMLAALDHARNIFGPPAEDAEGAGAAAADASRGATAAADLSPESPSFAPAAAPPATASDDPSASMTPTACALDAATPIPAPASTAPAIRAAAPTAAAPETT